MAAFHVIFVTLFLSLVYAFPASLVSGDTKTNSGFSVEVVRNPDHVRNGPAEYARALAKHGGQRLRGSNSFLAAGPSDNLPATALQYDREWVCTVGFGTPRQNLSMILDTGSSDVWAFSQEFNENHDTPHHAFNPQLSTSVVPVPNSSFQVGYGDGSYANGTVALDTITLGDVIIPGATIELATNAADGLANDLTTDGIFGLAYNFTNQISPRALPTVVSMLYKLIPAPLFTADLSHHNEGGYGYTFGYIELGAYTGDIHWTPVISDTTQDPQLRGFWSVDFSTLRVGATRFNLDISASTPRSAIVDTGTSLLLMPRYIVNQYYAMAPGAVQQDEHWIFPCAVHVPDFHIAFAGTDKGVWEATIPGKYINFSPYAPDNDTWCYGGIQNAPDDWTYSLFGDTFLKSVYAVFDYGAKRVGFASKNLDLS
ncbi:aspartic peptidase domain-containing protein [Bombardia bombarda]|uniref:Aspartic peptidase domain-containing protein n=1 Tax=Bombardia bombarda TaxID=252184 RepID=A0AA39XI00_9PEZI|nr:aspartic peptidase domain-containing protein [Bombardia bombarda]